MIRDGGCLKVGSKGRRMTSGGERKTGGGWTGQNSTGVEGLSRLKSREARISSMTHPVFLLLLFNFSIPNVSGKHPPDWTEVRASQERLSHEGWGRGREVKDK